jgi:hypothetical protein
MERANESVFILLAGPETDDVPIQLVLLARLELRPGAERSVVRHVVVKRACNNYIEIERKNLVSK